MEKKACYCGDTGTFYPFRCYLNGGLEISDECKQKTNAKLSKDKKRYWSKHLCLPTTYVLASKYTDECPANSEKIATEEGCRDAARGMAIVVDTICRLRRKTIHIAANWADIIIHWRRIHKSLVPLSVVGRV